MTMPQIIEKNGRPEWAVIPYVEYQRILARLEDMQDVEDADQALAEMRRGEDEAIPFEMVERLLDRTEHPMKIWREYRGLTQAGLAEKVGITKSYVSQIEAGKKPGSIAVLRRVATALDVDLEDVNSSVDM
ncbi:MAG: helix-turn-helix domain-containing protein [Thermoanaerobaculales bacterium]|nr:helix-turn-helix domain-containing protein [Thermoanaerobaculales bacterium]